MASRGWIACGLGLMAAIACESSDEGAPPAGEAGRGGEAGMSGAAGGETSAASGASAGSRSGGIAGSGGSTGSTGGSGDHAGSPAGGAGEPSAAGAGGAGGGQAGAGSGGEGGEGGEGGGAESGPAVAYVSTLFGELLVASLDPATGEPELRGSAPIEVEGNLNGVIVSPNRKFLFVPADPARIDTYAIQPDGSLPEEPSSSAEVDDENPLLTMAVDPLGRFAYGVSPFSQTIYVFGVDQTTGELTPTGEPLLVGPGPTHRGPAFVAPAPSGRFVYVTQMPDGPPTDDDGIRCYAVDQLTGELSEVEGSPFSAAPVFGGALAFRPDGKFLYSTGGGLNAFAVDVATGELNVLEGSPFSTDVQSDPWAPSIAMDPRGRRLYISNFGATRHITGFAIDAATGSPQKLPGDPVQTPSPYSIALGPGGRFLYVGDDTSQISVFSVSGKSGALTQLAGSPFPFGGLEPDIAFVSLP
ncbi:MAG: hypothetical protein EOO73_03160 [Myxococcales bacterium]|nr:MAG: hypothetical protein EOO73_03160 [Myxococcales bacterium]